jgi:hypothetical protein
LYVVFAEKSPEDADDYMSKLATGADIGEGHPIYTLRKAIFRNSIRPRGSNRYTSQRKAAFLVKTWNYYRKGKNLYQLKFKDTEQFPTAI